MTDTLSLEFEVAAAPDHAFAVWTDRLGTWWPAAKTLTGAPEALAFEPYVGGRIVETGPDGAEHAWGEVLAWEPPHRLAFTWHLFFDPAEATEVSVSFVASGDGTLVRLTQSGFDRLGAAGQARRDNTSDSWRVLLEAFAGAM